MGVGSASGSSMVLPGAGQVPAGTVVSAPADAVRAGWRGLLLDHRVGQRNWSALLVYWFRCVLLVPPTYSSPDYLGPGGAPAVVHSAGTYPAHLSLTDALATSPNTAFVGLEQQVGLDEVVHMAVSMGLTSLARPSTARGPLDLTRGGDPRGARSVVHPRR